VSVLRWIEEEWAGLNSQLTYGGLIPLQSPSNLGESWNNRTRP
jgi:hypothetical protein